MQSSRRAHDVLDGNIRCAVLPGFLRAKIFSRALITHIGNTFLGLLLRQFPPIEAAIAAAVLEQGPLGTIARRQPIGGLEVRHGSMRAGQAR